MLTYIKIAEYGHTVRYAVANRKQIGDIIKTKFEIEIEDGQADVELQIDINQLTEDLKPLAKQWGQIHMVTGADKRVPLSSVSRIPEWSEFEIAIFDYQTPEVDKAVEVAKERVAKWWEDSKRRDQKIDEIHHLIDDTLEFMSTRHPLQGSPKQISWADDIRWQALNNVIHEDPDGAVERIERDLTDPAKLQAKFWIDNRKALGYRG